ncbi:hypothetical protein MTX35_20725 [Rhodococcus sp. ARC_M12]|uniref:hypothetical protein n=1 Tax=unclassified Rhodococcus (in: high G+C Gram-positive bacteria) TaxID=192944 RepID=UPI001FB37679|nr:MULTISPECIES: hypothetical protein [unclassified Rhodococcus (in: high G+C Gram-positive bacteria)]MCJ0891981.1 hypothetical protein [Rhodococcus sp. ARC_M5]MCJ0980138.1 hypothetical protein [Rhodococcus sp. ARC_M12]
MILVPSLGSAGPNTLEELFAARYARGDMDRVQYLTRMDGLATRFNRTRTNTDRTSTCES